MKYLFFMLFCLIFTFQANCQTKGQAVDKIIQRNYNIIECKVTKITDKEIEYLELGNTVIFTIETSKVAAIHFANGAKKEFASANVSEPVKEIESTNRPSPSIKQQEQVTAKSNVIAVLPVVFVNTSTLQKSSDLSKFAQNDLYSKLMDKSSNIFPLTVQDTRVTNSLLRKANIDYNNIDEIPIEELRSILGVDHIIAGKVSYTTRTIVSNISNSSTNVSSQGSNGVKVNNSNGSFSEDETKYDYIVYFDMYRNNDKIYSKTREPMLSFKDSWMDSMQYLLKRSPVYTK